MATPVNYIIEGGTDFADDITIQVNGTPTLVTCNTVAGSAVVTVASTTGLVPGMSVIGAGIPVGDFIRSVGTGTITLDAPATATANGVVLSIGDFVGANFTGVNFLFSAKIMLPGFSPFSLQFPADSASTVLEFDWTQTNLTFGGQPIGMTFLKLTNVQTAQMLNTSLLQAATANSWNWYYEIKMVCPVNVVSSIQSGIILITQPTSARII